jgi:hypothetical protein
MISINQAPLKYASALNRNIPRLPAKINGALGL